MNKYKKEEHIDLVEIISTALDVYETKRNVQTWPEKANLYNVLD